MTASFCAPMFFALCEEGRYPVLLTYGPYAKGLAFQDGYPDAWETMAREHPDVAAGSTNLYQNWEVVDPEKWVPHGYACVRVDSRGCGRSPGYVDPFSPRETRDFDGVHRLGRRAAVEQRQGRPQRDFVLRDQSVAGRLAAASASGSDVRLGRRCGVVPRHFASRRHLFAPSGRTGTTCR